MSPHPARVRQLHRQEERAVGARGRSLGGEVVVIRAGLPAVVRCRREAQWRMLKYGMASTTTRAAAARVYNQAASAAPDRSAPTCPRGAIPCASEPTASAGREPSHPASDRSAGSSHTADSMTIATVRDAATANPLEETDAQNEQTQQGDDHRRARELNGAARCSPTRVRRPGCVACHHRLPEAVEDEQGVVDADTQTDHRRQGGGEGGHGEEAGGERDQDKPAPRPNTAVTIGRPAATADPNAISRMMIATRMPMASPLGGS